MADIVPCAAELRWTHNQPVWAMRARRVCSVRFLRSINRLCATPLASFCNSPRCLSLSLHNLVVRQRTTHTHTQRPCTWRCTPPDTGNGHVKVSRKTFLCTDTYTRSCMFPCVYITFFLLWRILQTRPSKARACARTHARTHAHTRTHTHTHTLSATQLASFCSSPRCLSLSLHNLVVRQRTKHRRAS